jgi:hypothetical protein
MGNFQMTDAKTWGNVVGNNLVVFLLKIYFILYMGKYHTKMDFSWGISK